MRRRGLTLVEILVVVGMLAVLFGAMLPPLLRTRQHSRMVACQTNIRHLLTAFTTYAGENDGRLPGIRRNNPADWLGRYTAGGRQPEDGTIFKKYMGRQKAGYTCPEDETPRPWTGPDGWFHSYTANALLSGLKPDAYIGAHYPMMLSEDNPAYHRVDHRQKMAPMEGVPLILEEDLAYKLMSVNDGSWCNDDGLTDRHLPTAGGGWGNIGYTDAHVGRFEWPKRVPATPVGYYLSAENLCLRTAGGNWISGKTWALGNASIPEKAAFTSASPQAAAPQDAPAAPGQVGGAGAAH